MRITLDLPDSSEAMSLTLFFPSESVKEKPGVFSVFSFHPHDGQVWRRSDEPDGLFVEVVGE